MRARVAEGWCLLRKHAEELARARVAETPRAWAGRRSPSNEKGPRAGPFHHAYSILAARAGRRCLREGLGSFHVLAGREVGRGPVRCRVGGALLGCELQDFDAPLVEAGQDSRARIKLKAKYTGTSTLCQQPYCGTTRRRQHLHCTVFVPTNPSLRIGFGAGRQHLAPFRRRRRRVGGVPVCAAAAFCYHVSAVFSSSEVCGRGGIGRRARFRFWWATPVKVQVLSPAPFQIPW